MSLAVDILLCIVAMLLVKRIQSMQELKWGQMPRGRPCAGCGESLPLETVQCPVCGAALAPLELNLAQV
jgi:hypothetical protein